MKLILASQSPRRKELLSHIVTEFDISPADIDETPIVDESPTEYVQRMALEKARKVAQSYMLDGINDAVVIGSDTTVIKDNQILGKPEDLEQAVDILSLLSNTTHQVLTSFAVVSNDIERVETVVTDVQFVALSRDDIEAYWHTGEPQDKAGAYGIQGIGGKFVQSVNGSVSSVVGLPLAELNQVLKELGVI